MTIPMGTKRSAQPAAASGGMPSSVGGRPARTGAGSRAIASAKPCAMRLRCSATVTPKITSASSPIMKMPSRLNGAFSLKSTNPMILGNSSPVTTRRPIAHPNQSRTPVGVGAS